MFRISLRLMKIQSEILHWAKDVFFKCLRIYAIWVFVANNWILHFVQNFTPVDKMISKIQSDPSPLGYGIFFLKNRFGRFLKNVPRLFRFLWVHHIYSYIYIFDPSVLQFFSPSVLQSFNSSVRQSVIPSVRPSVIEICSPFLTVPRF